MQKAGVLLTQTSLRMLVFVARNCNDLLMQSVEIRCDVRNKNCRDRRSRYGSVTLGV